ncbi:glycine-rich domain-containing protein [Flexibacterium corallicola]|uniref:glycine-rich domain-containing protein n=1 Tax=Flexibacterium corallicola TaxID=3037259 RepID=UPI00286FA2D0|nr:hypothetical protein [Pseudovibrio sp. M1P-2-3]
MFENQSNGESCDDPIATLDLSPILKKVTASFEDGGYDWPVDETQELIEVYRSYLFDARAYLRKCGSQDRPSLAPPSREVDILWHTHILFTRKYMGDCDRIFGHYLHHEPISPE